jgi:septal ring-binding cell division protein DamX
MGGVLQAQGQWAKAEPWFSKVVAANNDQTLYSRALSRMHAAAYTLQYGAFQDSTGAQDMLVKLKAAGVTAKNPPPAELREGKVWYLVQSGSYATWSEAAAARNQVLPKFPLAVIVP